MKVPSAIQDYLLTTSNFLFYKDVMEFDVTVNNEEGGYAEFKVAEICSLFRRQEMAEIIDNAHKPPHAECQDNVALIFVVPDLDETYHKLRHKGIKFTAEPMSNPYYELKQLIFAILMELS